MGTETTGLSVERGLAPLAGNDYDAIASMRCADEQAITVTAESLLRDDEWLSARGAAPTWQIAQHADYAAMLRMNEALGYRRMALRVGHEKGFT